jgi:predicted AAA+ superfamily ATPase
MDNNPYPIFGATIPACRGREPDMEKIVRLIAKNHVSVVGPKHIGKTVFIHALAGHVAAGKDSFTGSVYVSVR